MINMYCLYTVNQLYKAKSLNSFFKSKQSNLDSVY
jgi:hypothetical protein